MAARNTSTVELPEVIRRKLSEIIAPARSFDVERLEVFGSVMTDRYSPFSSDIDFLVTYPADYDHGPFLGRYQELERELGYLMGTRVDLVMATALERESFRIEANKTRKVLYDASPCS
ncbi:MAG TPA: nucleotidyltransferase domain-containing protein [Thermomicrobiales bacterium]|nr:nucleotidyltransferase domain-containing protein [Thermomicrobiales bacterium]